jgi:hypothetical protein
LVLHPLPNPLERRERRLKLSNTAFNKIHYNFQKSEKGLVRTSSAGVIHFLFLRTEIFDRDLIVT